MQKQSYAEIAKPGDTNRTETEVSTIDIVKQAIAEHKKDEIHYEERQKNIIIYRVPESNAETNDAIARFPYLEAEMSHRANDGNCSTKLSTAPLMP